MSGDGSPDFVLGTYGDPAVFYGPSASRIMATHRETEVQVLDIAPMDGPLAAGHETAGTGGLGMGAGRGINPRAFVKTPAGALLLLLPIAWILYDRVFGVA